MKHDGNIDFSINQKTFVQELVEDLVFSRRDFDLMKPNLEKSLLQARVKNPL